MRPQNSLNHSQGLPGPARFRKAMTPLRRLYKMCLKHIMKSHGRTGLVSNAVREKAKRLPSGVRNLRLFRILKKAMEKVRA